MCTTCKSILGKYAKPHTTPCPLSKACYCSICAVYGHTAKRCNRTDIEGGIVNENINLINSEYSEMMVKVTNIDGSVRAALISNGITPMTCQDKGKKVQKDFIENKKRLMEYTKTKGLVLVLISPTPYDETS